MDDNKHRDKKILFIPEWSIWDMAINHHHENQSKPSKDFLYKLLVLNKQFDIILSTIPVQLEEALNAAFSDRKGALDFFLDQDFLNVETLPTLYPHVKGHRTAVLLLAHWKAIDYKEVYVVAEDRQTLKTVAEDLERQGLNCSHMIITPSEALKKILIL